MIMELSKTNIETTIQGLSKCKTQKTAKSTPMKLNIFFSAFNKLGQTVKCKAK